MNFAEACAAAIRMSKMHGCAVHVNAQVRLDGFGKPYVTGFYLSDRYNNDNTLATYVNGERKDA